MKVRNYGRRMANLNRNVRVCWESTKDSKMNEIRSSTKGKYSMNVCKRLNSFSNCSERIKNNWEDSKQRPNRTSRKSKSGMRSRIKWRMYSKRRSLISQARIRIHHNNRRSRIINSLKRNNDWICILYYWTSNINTGEMMNSLAMLIKRQYFEYY